MTVTRESIRVSMIEYSGLVLGLIEAARLKKEGDEHRSTNKLNRIDKKVRELASDISLAMVRDYCPIIPVYDAIRDIAQGKALEAYQKLMHLHQNSVIKGLRIYS